MKYFYLIILLVAAACGSSKKMTINDPANATGQGKNTIQIKVNEVKTIQLPGSVSGSPQINFTLSDSSVATVSRNHMISTYDSTGLRPGDPVLAVWVIKGLKPGTTSMKFRERLTVQTADGSVRLKEFRIVVRE